MHNLREKFLVDKDVMLNDRYLSFSRFVQSNCCPIVFIVSHALLNSFQNSIVKVHHEEIITTEDEKIAQFRKRFEAFHNMLDTRFMTVGERMKYEKKLYEKLKNKTFNKKELEKTLSTFEAELLSKLISEKKLIAEVKGDLITFKTKVESSKNVLPAALLLNPKKDEILSIGAVKIKDNKILTSQIFEVYLKNTKEISSKSIEIHQIRPCDLQNATDVEEGIKDFLKFIGSRPLIGYYLEFDVAMINKYIKPMLGITLPNRMIEVSEIYFDKTIALIPQGNIDLRFDTILQKCGVPDMGAHNAVNDAIMTAMIFLKLTIKK